MRGLGKDNSSDNMEGDIPKINQIGSVVQSQPKTMGSRHGKSMNSQVLVNVEVELCMAKHGRP